MSSLDANNVFGSGPHSICPGSWQRSLDRRGFAGVDGELTLDMGLRSRTIVQKGRLQAVSASALREQILQVEAFIDGRTHELVDDHGAEYEFVLVEHFELTTPVRRGRGYFCDYVIRYRQLP